VKKLQAEVRQLKDQIAFLNRDSNQPSDRVLSADEMERCRQMVQQFVEDSDSSAQMGGLGGDLARILSCFQIMKAMVRGAAGGNLPKGHSEKASSTPSGRVGVGDGALSSEVATLQRRIEEMQISLQQKENELSMLFSIVEKSNVPKFNTQTQTGAGPLDGGGMMVPARSAAVVPPTAMSVMASTAASQPAGPLPPLQNLKNHRESMKNLSEAQSLAATEFLEKQEALRESYDLSALTDAELLKDRAAAFESFRRSYRKYEQVERNKVELKTMYDNCRRAAELVNQQVDAIKGIKSRVQQLRAERALQGIADPDDEEVSLMQRLDQSKKLYSQYGNDLRVEKEKVEHMHLIMSRAQEQLAKDFEEWFGMRQKQILIATCGGQRIASEEAMQPPPESIRKSLSAPADTSQAHQFQLPPPSVTAFQATQPVRPHTLEPADNFLSIQHRKIVDEHKQHNRRMELELAPKNPFAPQYPSTGNAEADAQLAQMYKAREEMKAKLFGSK
jgi:hypothetical protein